MVAESREVVIRDLSLLTTTEFDDPFRFEVEQSIALDELDGGMAVRFRVRAMLANERFEVFDVDVGFDHPRAIGTEHVVGGDVLAYASIPPVEMDILSVEQHLAEKLHAYTRTYAGERRSSRVKDLIDIVLLSQLASVTAHEVAAAIRSTFGGREAHAVPERLPMPPADWETPYRTLAQEVGIEPRLEAGWAAAAEFLDPVLGGGVDPGAVWSPEGQRWVVG